MMIKKKITLIVPILLLAFVFLTCDDDNEPSGLPITSNMVSNYQGYDYEFWTDSRGAGSGKMILTGGGSFYCTWSNTFNILFRMGKKFGSTQTHSEIGEIQLTYAMADYAPVGTSYVTVYGWTQNPLVEYYITENWGSSGYKGVGGSDKVLKTVTINGAQYDIYEQTHTGPSIEGSGNKTFKQYRSIRKTASSAGTIDVSEHFKAWEAAGLTMGKLYEVAFCIEAYGGDARNASGKANVLTNILTVNGKEVNQP